MSDYDAIFDSVSKGGKAPANEYDDIMQGLAPKQSESIPKQPIGNGATGTWEAPPMSRMDRFTQGLKDPISGGAQLLTNMLPQGVVQAGNTANNWLADKTGLVGRLPAGGVDQQVREQEAQYQARRGDTGLDAYRLLGNVANPANIAIASRLPQAATLAGRVGVGAGGGALSGLLNPVTDGDFNSEKSKQVGLGAAFGGAIPAVTGGLARVVSPNASTNPNLALLKAEGVKPTVGQSLGGWANTLEERAQSIPIVGDAITAARRGTWDDARKAAFNRVLEPVGKTLPKGVDGNDAILAVRQTLGKEYERVLPKLTTKADAPFTDGVMNLRNMVSQGAIDPKYTALFDKTLQTRVLDKFQGQNSISGETLKDTQSFLSKEITRFGASQDPDARLIGDAYKELGSQLKDLSIRSNPKYASELKAIDTAYANFKRVQKAGSSVAAEDGMFSPAQLHNAVKASDKSKDKARFSEGGALMQDLSGAAKASLGSKINDSGTAGRIGLGLGTLGVAGGAGAMLSSPVLLPVAGSLLGGAAMYTSPMQSLLRGAVSSRPNFAKPTAQSIRDIAPYFIPAGAQFGHGLLD